MSNTAASAAGQLNACARLLELVGSYPDRMNLEFSSEMWGPAWWWYGAGVEVLDEVFDLYAAGERWQARRTLAAPRN
jgi:hypothetical protein